jgi:putative DNA primase/helicase
MPTVADVARIWQHAGVSTIPILANQTKRPAFRWSPYQVNLPTAQQVDQWWGNTEEYGLALVCGPVSGNLEMCEIEGRVFSDPAALMDIINRMDEGGAGPIWDLLTGPDGYAEDSPSGGTHLLYRITDHPVPGNTKIAADENHVVLAETRGHGGYVIVAPTSGNCHPSGEPWRLVNGNYGHLPQITWAERNLLHECLRVALDKTPQVPIVVPLAESKEFSRALVTRTPGDVFEDDTDWADILEPHGWQVVMSTRDGERHWVRPGKHPRDGMSATTGRANDRDRLYVFSTSTVFEAEVPYTKFGAYALLNFNGDHSRAASHLARAGYGDRRGVVDVADVAEWAPPEVKAEYTEDDIGNAQLLADRIRGKYRYIWEEKNYYRWTGDVWTRDTHNQVLQEWTAATVDMAAQGQDKWAARCRNQSRTNAAISMAKSWDLTHSATEWAPESTLLNLKNGVLNLKTEEFMEHDPKYLMTHKFGTSYIPGATCARFEKFMADAIPNPEMRAYVQRALGYSLLGKPGARSIFLIYGPSGTGKSTLVETIRAVFGEYGATAGSGTFRANPGNGPTPDLHALQGRRFVTTSETSETATFDEDLLKRISGRDQITSRTLYGEPVEWTPECALWVATNNPPKFNSDDDAIWRRTKLIPFTTVFRGEGEIEYYAQDYLIPEAPGILNWLLVGLRDYLAGGLQEPEEIERLAMEQRNDSDSVARFIMDRQADAVLVVGDGERVDAQDLYNQYMMWAGQMGERNKLGNRRFTLRLLSILPAVQRQHGPGKPAYIGVGYRTAGTWLRTPPTLFPD